MELVLKLNVYVLFYAVFLITIDYLKHFKIIILKNKFFIIHNNYYD